MFSKSLAVALTAVVSAFAATFAAAPLWAAEIHGQISFESKRRLSRDAQPEIAVVFYRPDAHSLVEHNTNQSISAAVAGEPVEMRMSMKAFQPTVIAVRTGTEVSFPNADRVIHNAFSTTRGNSFDLGLYPQGESHAHRFDTPGVVNVYCNVHQNMRGYVVVLDTPHYAMLNEDGSFQLTDLPEGSGKLFVWHPRGKTVSQAVSLRAEPLQFEATMALTKRSLPKHKNKFGKPYKRNRDY